MVTIVPEPSGTAFLVQMSISFSRSTSASSKPYRRLSIKGAMGFFFFQMQCFYNVSNLQTSTQKLCACSWSYSVLAKGTAGVFPNETKECKELGEKVTGIL